MIPPLRMLIRMASREVMGINRIYVGASQSSSCKATDFGRSRLTMIYQ